MGIKVIRVLALAIMVAAASVSFGTQRAVFTAWHAGAYTAVVAPLSIDLLAILCNLALHTEHVARSGRRVAALVLVVTMGGSLTANWMAPGVIGSKAVHSGMVLLYVLAEWVSSRVVTDVPTASAKRSAAARKAAATRKANAAKRTRKPRAPRAATVRQLEQAYAMPSAPVSPAQPSEPTLF